MSASVTFLCGPKLGGLTASVAKALDVGWGCLKRGPQDEPDHEVPLNYTKTLLVVLMSAAAHDRPAVLWLPDAGPQLTTHQRRSLERVVQGLRPAALVEVGGQSYPSWLRCAGGGLPVYPLEGAEGAEGAAGLERSLRRVPSPSHSSKNSAGEFLEERLAKARPLNPGAGTGSWRPGGVMLVGDRPNARSWAPGRVDAAVSWPFVSQLGTGCSSWLSEQLEASGTPETQLYWQNAYRANGELAGDLAELRSKLRPALVVALGSHAAHALDLARDVDYEEVHHPAYWKRFHFGQTYRLTQLLSRRASKPS